MPHITEKSLNFMKNVFRKPNSISLKMSSKRNEIFEKASNRFKKASRSLKIFFKCHAFF
jgi:hypothetical protein